jgi:hypothetical protein
VLTLRAALAFRAVIGYRTGVFALFCAACGSSPLGPAGGPSAPSGAQARASPSSSSNQQPGRARAPARLERKYTGQATPTLVVKNEFPIGQHVFLDQKPLGKIEASSTATFEVPVGVHTLTSADSADQDDNPVSITESFEPGFSYSYAITPE